MHYKDT